MVLAWVPLLPANYALSGGPPLGVARSRTAASRGRSATLPPPFGLPLDPLLVGVLLEHAGPLSDPAFTFAIALAAGMVATIVAHHLRVPGIVIFLLAGVVLGPDVLDVVRPHTLGAGLELLVGLAVAVILFEGGLSLNIDRLRREAKTIRRLVTLGAVVTAIGGTLLARLFMGWSWTLAVLFGTLVIVTGPTVITPLLRRIRVEKNLQTILEAEGVLIDPVGAIVAVVALEVILAGNAAEAAFDLLGIPSRLLLGLVVGAIGGFVIALILRYERYIPDNITNVFTLGLVLALFEISNAIQPESGIMAAAVAGMVVGNMRERLTRELAEFKEQLTVMLVALLFVLLAADVRLADVAALGLPGLLTILGLMLIVRPIGVALCSAGSSLGRPQRIFMSWLSPRGIVAAAVASLFATRLGEAGFAGGEELRALVFLVIAVTVVVQGGTGGWVASRLNVRRARDNGFAIVGANPVSRALGASLRDGGHDIVLLDSNAREARAAEEAGFTVIYGNASEDRQLVRADIEGRAGFLALTPNPDANLLIANHVHEMTRLPETYVLLARGKAGARARRVRRDGHHVLFGRAIEMSQWNHQLEQGSARVERWRYAGPPSEDAVEGGADPGAELERGSHLIPLTIEVGGKVDVVHEETEVRPGAILTLLLAGDKPGRVDELLKVAGWSPVHPPRPEPKNPEGAETQEAGAASG